jgi:TrmH family RNA methyltransferase
VQAARKLHKRAHRERAGAFLAEGPQVVLEALHAGAGVAEVFVSAELPALHEVIAAAEARGVPVTRATASVIAALSEAATPQGAVAVVDAPSFSLDELPETADLVLVLAAVRDPGNAGTLIRSAVAAGADAVVLPKGAVDPLHPKTVRATAGALFRVPLLGGGEAERSLRALRARGFTLVGADTRAPRAPEEIDLTRPTALVLGNEAWGLPPDLATLLDERVGIPMPGPAESLNVGIAGSILLFEAVRQRRGRGSGR